MFTHGGKTMGASLFAASAVLGVRARPIFEEASFFRLGLLLGKWLYSPCGQIDTFQLTALQVTFHRTLRTRKIEAKMDVILVLLLF